MTAHPANRYARRMKQLRPDDPQVLGGIELRGWLDRGGMGVAYLGATPDGEPVVVKTILEAYRRDDSQAEERFDREIRAMEIVQGPRVAQLIEAYDPDDLGPDDEGTAPRWFAAEYIPGLTLTQYVEERSQLPAGLAAALGIGLAEALGSIHDAGILHRDLKPSNIIMAEDGPRVIDFGLAALTGMPSDLSYSNQRLGTPLCMAPEQVLSPKVGPPADVYSLGAVLVFALTGHYPYERVHGAAVQAAVASASVEADLAGVPESMLGPVRAMLAHAAAARPTLSQVTQELTQVLADAGYQDPAEALMDLARRTYIERDIGLRPAAPSKPEPVPTPPPENPHVPSQLVRKIAGDLRAAYAGAAAF